MRPFLIFSVGAVFACCLGLLVPLRPAVAQVTSGTASCPEGTAEKIDDGVGCVTPLKVRPPGHGGGSNPNDWGMCGILNFSGVFSPVSRVRIIVDASGYYAALLVGATPATVPKMDWTYVFFKDFTRVPPDSDATSSGPPFPSYNGGSAGGSTPISGSPGNACIWGVHAYQWLRGKCLHLGGSFRQFGDDSAGGRQRRVWLCICEIYGTGDSHRVTKRLELRNL
jgi:hypothetical protein